MFLKQGWVSLVEFYYGARAKYDEKVNWDDVAAAEAPRLVREELEQDINRAACLESWWVSTECADANQAAVLTTSNKLVTVASMVFDWNDEDKPKGKHVHLGAGTLGSGSMAEASDSEYWRETLYGPFLYCPVFLHRATADQIRGKEGPRSPLRKDLHRAAADNIVAAVDRGEPVTKAWARERYGSDMKYAEFQLTWEMATKVRPQLSKPGPRGPRE